MATSELLNLRPLYFADRRFVASEAPESRLADVGKWLGALKKRQDLSVAARNQVLFDAVHLLADDWSEEKANNWNFIDVGNLAARLPALKARKAYGSSERSKAILSDLDGLVERAKAETYPTFEEFRKAELYQRQKMGQRFADVEEFSRWFATNRAYLTLGLEFPPELDDDEVEARILDRIDFFLERLPENTALEPHFGEIARQHIDLELIQSLRSASSQAR